MNTFTNILKVGLFVIFSLILMTGLAYGYFYFLWPLLGEKASNFGEMYGAFNAVISGTALLSVAYTIYLQHKQIQSSKEDTEKQLKLITYSAQISIFEFLERLGNPPSKEQLDELKNEIDSTLSK